MRFRPVTHQEAGRYRQGGTLPATDASPIFSTAYYLISQHLETKVDLNCRECLVAKMVDLSFALHTISGGSTVSLFEGNLLGRSLFAVSIYPERSVELQEFPSRSQLWAFAMHNADLLTLRGHALGSWIRKENDRHVLDVVVCLPQLEDAIWLALMFSQEAIFDLRSELEIPTTRTLDIMGPESFALLSR